MSPPADGGRRPGVLLLGTARDREQAADWQKRLVDAGVQSIVRGHRANGAYERRPEFSGLDVWVPSTMLSRAREIIAPVAAEGQLQEEQRSLPWAWMFAAPAIVLAAVAVLLIAVVL